MRWLTSGFFHKKLHTSILLTSIGPHPTWPTKLSCCAQEFPCNGVGSVIVGGKKECHHARVPVDSAVYDYAPPDQLVMPINVPERVDPWDPIDPTKKETGLYVLDC
jgi:hypothetical protein